MGESLTERRRVKDEGLRVVNFFGKGRNQCFALGISKSKFQILNQIQMIKFFNCKNFKIKSLKNCLKIENLKLKIPVRSTG